MWKLENLWHVTLALNCVITHSFEFTTKHLKTKRLGRGRHSREWQLSSWRCYPYKVWLIIYICYFVFYLAFCITRYKIRKESHVISIPRKTIPHQFHSCHFTLIWSISHCNTLQYIQIFLCNVICFLQSLILHSRFFLSFNKQQNRRKKRRGKVKRRLNKD